VLATFALPLVTIVAAVAGGRRWLDAREAARREARALAPALSASAALCDELAPVVRQGADLLDRASISSDPTEAIAFQTRQLHTGVAAIEARLAAHAAAQRSSLTDVGVDLGPILQVLGQANAAVQGVSELASRACEIRTSEACRASARHAAAKLSQVAQLVNALQADIRRREMALQRLAS
jgi:hypothetical protein